MQITSHLEPFPYVIVDGLFPDAEYKAMAQEWMTLEPSALDPMHTDSARDDQGRILKQNSGLFVDHVYRDKRDASPTLTYNRALFAPEFTELLTKINPTYGLVATSSVDKTLVSYYGEGSHYGVHHDVSTVTALTYYLPQGKCFSGGVLRFVDYGVEIAPKNNQTILFLGCFRHEVTPIQGGSGTLRVTMSQFVGNWQ